MDNGAHFYKTDLQIHTPRDSNWTGCKPVTPEDRLEFARRFVVKCRELGIQAVGITEHHDICFIEYFQLAAQNGDFLKGVDPTKQRPIIFPGMELTLQVPCQAIVLLDAQCDQSIQFTMLQLLDLQHVYNKDEKECAQPNPLPFHSLQDLHDKLNENTILRDRFIVLPHVGQDGHKSILRESFQDKYKSMPCVGGYVEKNWDELRDKNRNIINGVDPVWGKKSVGLFQTSDSRREDFAELGKRNTWVKFAGPTAEALRQACLASGSRIKQTQPKLPDIFIQRIEVSNSKFLGQINLDFNPQYNALIGGRGTGKTSVLEYIRYAMQDQPVSDSPEMSDQISLKRESIIETVTDCRGTIKVYWLKNNVEHVLCLNSEDRKPALSIEGGEYEEIDPGELRKMLPIQAYSQKQLSVVGTRIQELQRFIEQPIQEQLNDCNQRIEQARTQIRNIYAALCEYNKKQKQLKGNETQLVSIQSQIDAIKRTLTKIPAELETALNEHPLRLKEKESIISVESDLQEASDSLVDLIKLLDSLPRQVPIDEDYPQKLAVEEIFTDSQKVIGEVKNKLLALKKDWRNSQVDIKKKVRTWKTKHRAHLKKYSKAQDESEESKEKLVNIEKLQNQAAALQKNIIQLKADIQKHQQKHADFNEAWSTWTQKHAERGDLLEKICSDLTHKSAGEIKAQILRGADIKEPVEKLKHILTGCSITQDRWDTLKEYLEKHQESPAKAWMEIMEQLRPLAELEENDITQGARLPDIPNWDLTPKMRERAIQRFSPQNWLEIALVSLKDKPVFYYCPNDRQQIPFENASAGQQATALLKVLLGESTGPLIIDQPEDDLDNSVIWDIAETIWKAKESRQLIFASHNANLVVNGDAELVVQFNYRDENDRTSGTIENQGAIDVRDVREAITRVMEGGRKAFELRRQKYGF
ncbi:MAG: TrlF family AAA-like ATPase [Planctomycetota bacterium]